MATQLLVAGFPTGGTIYAIIRRNSDNYAYNNTTSLYEDYNPSNLNDYKINLTEQDASAFYTADIPAAANDGLLNVEYFGNGSFIGSEQLYYDQAIVPPSGTLLCSLADYKTLINDTSTSKDALRTMVLGTASDLVESVVHRSFRGVVKDEIYDGTGTFWLALYDVPASISSVTFDPNGTPTVVDVTKLAIDGKVIYFKDLATTFPPSYQNVEVVYTAPSVIPTKVRQATAELALRMEQRLDLEGIVTSQGYEGASQSRKFLGDLSYIKMAEDLLDEFNTPFIA